MDDRRKLGWLLLAALAAWWLWRARSARRARERDAGQLRGGVGRGLPAGRPDFAYRFLNLTGRKIRLEAYILLNNDAEKTVWSARTPPGATAVIAPSATGTHLSRLQCGGKLAVTVYDADVQDAAGRLGDPYLFNWVPRCEHVWNTLGPDLVYRIEPNPDADEARNPNLRYRVTGV